MRIIGLGKITVVTHGSLPVQFSATQIKVSRVIVSFDGPGDTTATVYVKDSAGTIIAALVSGNPPLIFGDGTGGNEIDLSTLYADASADSKGPYVGYELT